MADRCINKKCNEDLTYPHYDGGNLFCPSCKYIGNWGVFAGSLIVGLIVGILKLFNIL